MSEKQRIVERGIWTYLAVFFCFTILAWMPFFLHGLAKTSFPLSEPSERFGDLAHFAAVPQKLANPRLEDSYHLAGTMFPRNYGPLAVIIYFFFLKVCSPYGIVVFLAIFVFSLIVSSFLLWRAAGRSPSYRPIMGVAIFATSLLALPTAETELRGNIEGMVWIGYAAAISAMFSSKWGKSASTLGIASCIKPYPFLWFVLFFFHRKYRDIIVGVVITLITAGVCLTLLGAGNPNVGALGITGGGSAFFDSYIVGFRHVREASADHSLFQFFKSVCRVIEAGGFRLRPEDYQHRASVREGYILLACYLPFAAISLLGTLWIIRRKSMLNQIFALSICLTLFPLLAADYTLTILYIPMGMFLLFLLVDVADGSAVISQTRILLILVPCAWLMAPQPLLGIWAGDVKTIALLFLLVTVVNTPMPMGRLRSPNPLLA